MSTFSSALLNEFRFQWAREDRPRPYSGPQVPGGGYEYWWSDAGAVVARAALEVLHRATGEMADDERAALGPATRLEEAAQ